MPERKKVEPELNKPLELELLYDEPRIGQSRYGDYFLYTVRNGTDEELSFFAPNEDIHNQLKVLKKGDRFTITKTAVQKGSKVVTDYKAHVSAAQIQPKPNGNGTAAGTDAYYDILLKSYQDGLKIQEKLNGMVDVNKVAITLFIARSKLNGLGGRYE